MRPVACDRVAAGGGSGWGGGSRLPGSRRVLAGRPPAVGACTKIGGNWPDVVAEAAIIVKPSARNGEQGGMGKFNLLMSKVPHH